MVRNPQYMDNYSHKTIVGEFPLGICNTKFNGEYYHSTKYLCNENNELYLFEWSTKDNINCTGIPSNNYTIIDNDNYLCHSNEPCNYYRIKKTFSLNPMNDIHCNNLSNSYQEISEIFINDKCIVMETSETSQIKEYFSVIYGCENDEWFARKWLTPCIFSLYIYISPMNFMHEN